MGFNVQWFKHVIKRCMPPIFLDGIRYLQKPSYRWPLIESEAQELAKTDVFQSDAWVKHILRKLASSSPLPLIRDGHMPLQYFLLSTLISLRSFNSPMRVVDWGGGGCRGI